MKTSIIQNLKGVILTAIILVSSIMTGYSAAHVTMTADNCSVTNNVIQFRATITNDGTEVVSFNAMVIRMGFNPAVLNGSPTVTCAYAGGSDFPASFATLGGSYDIAYRINDNIHYLSLITKTGDYDAGSAISIAIGQTLVLGTFSITTTTNFVPNVPVNLTWDPTTSFGATIPSGVLLYVGTDITTTGFETSANLAFNGPCSATTPSTLNLTLFLQGYYLGGGMMQQVLLNEGVETNASSTQCDTVIVSLIDPSNGTLVQRSKGVLQTNGSLSVFFPSSIISNSYYIYIQQRNSMETSSASAVTFSSTTSYDFSSSASQAYGSNMANLGGGKWGLFTGDMNQDGYIDPFDFVPYDTDNQNQLADVYVNTDLDGNGYVDPFDFPVYDTNNSNQVTANLPWQFMPFPWYFAE